MLRTVRAALVVWCVAPCLAFSAALPQAHRHDADGHHPHATIHQHLEAHDHDGAEVSPNRHGQITWFERVATPRGPVPFFVPVPVVVAYLSDVPVPSRWVAVEALDTAPPHGPPRQTLSLRAPPASPSSPI